jgi:hypothetical protein
MNREVATLCSDCAGCTPRTTQLEALFIWIRDFPEGPANMATHVVGQQAQGGMPSRTHTLTNSAAEFLENRISIAETSPEFVPELDRFVAKDDIPREDYYKESQERLKQFQITLAAFQKNLVGRKIDQRYEVDIKDATDYTLNDVLRIAQTVQQKHKDADKVHSCMGRIRKFFRATGKNSSTFKKLIEAFAPNDIYGSVICGGFTVILGVRSQLVLMWCCSTNKFRRWKGSKLCATRYTQVIPF